MGGVVQQPVAVDSHMMSLGTASAGVWGEGGQTPTSGLSHETALSAHRGWYTVCCMYIYRGLFIEAAEAVSSTRDNILSTIIILYCII